MWPGFGSRNQLSAICALRSAAAAGGYPVIRGAPLHERTHETEIQSLRCRTFLPTPCLGATNQHLPGHVPCPGKCCASVLSLVSMPNRVRCPESNLDLGVKLCLCRIISREVTWAVGKWHLRGSHEARDITIFGKSGQPWPQRSSAHVDVQGRDCCKSFDGIDVNLPLPWAAAATRARKQMRTASFAEPGADLAGHASESHASLKYDRGILSGWQHRAAQACQESACKLHVADFSRAGMAAPCSCHHRPRILCVPCSSAASAALRWSQTFRLSAHTHL